MPYAVKQDMVTRFTQPELIQLTDREGAADAIDDEVLNRALADADAEIDGYLVGRYTLPLATVPRILTGVACDIARYRLYDDRATEHVRQRYEDAVKLLRSVAEGKLTLGLDANNQPTPTTSGAQFTEPQRTFTRDSLSDY